MSNPLKRALLEHRPTLGIWMQIAHAAPMEIVAALGFDWVCVDIEHASTDMDQVAGLFRAVAGTQAVPVARLPWCDPVWIKRVLDAGAGGIIVPMVNSAEMAELAVREAQYPPAGRRSFGFSRMNAWGLQFEEYATTANQEIAVIAQVEHKDAIADLDRILQVEGLDATLIGPYDLSGSYGKPGDLSCPEVKQALSTYLEACRRYHKPAGTLLVYPTETAIRSALGEGYNLVGLGVDTVLLAQAAKDTLQLARSVAAKSAGC
jgi:2-dehydro-3-deoxyglucarate aldolase